MKVKELELKNFKKFPNLKLKFRDGINVIIGPNEAGKSTLTRAIIDGLYADPTTRARQFLDEIYPWNQAQEVEIKMKLESGELEFLLHKDFHKKEMTLENSDSGAQVKSQKELNAVIAKITNIPSREIYLATAFIRQSDLVADYSSAEFISAIHNTAAASGTKVNVQNVIKTIRRNLAQLKVGLDHPAKNPGKLKLISEQIAALRSELTEKSAAWQRVQKATVDNKDSQGEIAEVAKKIQTLDQLLTNYRSFQEGSKELEKLNVEITAHEKKLREVERLEDQLKQLDSQLKAYAKLSKLDLDKLSLRIARLEQVVKLTKTEVQAEQRMPAEVVKNDSNYNWPLLLLALLLQALPLLLGEYQYLLVTLAVAAAIVWRFGRRPTSSAAPVQAAPAPDTEERHQRAKSDLAQLLTELGVASASEFYTRKADFQALLARRQELLAQLKGILGDEDKLALENRQVELIKQKKEIEVTKLSEEVKNANLSPEQYLRTTRELDELYLRQKELESKKTSAQVRLEDAEVSAETLIDLEERLELALAEQGFWQKRASVYELSAQALEQAVGATAKNAGSIVSKEIELYLPKLTGGSYSQARLDPSLNVEIFAEAKNDWIRPETVLSQGTVDQIYLLTRIAFVKTLVKDKSVPLIFDDPFVTFDAERKTQLREIITELAKTYQIFILSHDPLYEGWGNSINLSEH